MVDKDLSHLGEERGPIFDRMRSLIDSEAAIPFELGEHPYLPSINTEELSIDSVIGKQFYTEGPQGLNGIFEFVQVAELSEMAALLFRDLETDFDIPHFILRIGLVGPSKKDSDDLSVLSLVINFNSLGQMVSAAPIQNNTLSSEIISSFVARMEDWGFEIGHRKVKGMVHIDMKLNDDWQERINYSLSVLA